MEKNQKIHAVEVFEVENTPFNVILHRTEHRNENNEVTKTNEQFSIVCGNEIVSAQSFDTLEDAKEYVYSKPWELISTLIFAMYKNIKKANEYAKDNN